MVRGALSSYNSSSYSLVENFKYSDSFVAVIFLTNSFLSTCCSLVCLGSSYAFHFLM